MSSTRAVARTVSLCATVAENSYFLARSGIRTSTQLGLLGICATGAALTHLMAAILRRNPRLRVGKKFAAGKEPVSTLRRLRRPSIWLTVPGGGPTR